MASIRVYRTSKGERRYAVRYRDPAGRTRARSFSVQRDAQAFMLELERRQQAGLLYQAPPERFRVVADAWLERYVIGAAGGVRPRPGRLPRSRKRCDACGRSTTSRSSASAGR